MFWIVRTSFRNCAHSTACDDALFNTAFRRASPQDSQAWSRQDALIRHLVI